MKRRKKVSVSKRPEEAFLLAGSVAKAEFVPRPLIFHSSSCPDLPIDDMKECAAPPPLHAPLDYRRNPLPAWAFRIAGRCIRLRRSCACLRILCEQYPSDFQLNPDRYAARTFSAVPVYALDRACAAMPSEAIQSFALWGKKVTEVRGRLRGEIPFLRNGPKRLARSLSIQVLAPVCR
jgi:hypothetical protein